MKAGQSIKNNRKMAVRAKHDLDPENLSVIPRDKDENKDRIFESRRKALRLVWNLFNSPSSALTADCISQLKKFFDQYEWSFHSDVNFSDHSMFDDYDVVWPMWRAPYDIQCATSWISARRKQKTANIPLGIIGVTPVGTDELTTEGPFYDAWDNTFSLLISNGDLFRLKWLTAQVRTYRHVGLTPPEWAVRKVESFHMN